MNDLKISNGMSLFVTGDGRAWLWDEARERSWLLGKLHAVKIGNGVEPEVFETVRRWPENVEEPRNDA